MTQPLLFDERVRSRVAASLSQASRACRAAGPPRSVPTMTSRGGSRAATPELVTFEERRARRERATEGDVAMPRVRSPLVLGFVGVITGLAISTVLILLVSLALAVTGVTWAAASYYGVAAVLAAFGVAGAAMNWSVQNRHRNHAEWLARVESVVERRRYRFDISSLNALENFRALNASMGQGALPMVRAPIRVPQRSGLGGAQVAAQLPGLNARHGSPLH